MKFLLQDFFFFFGVELAWDSVDYHLTAFMFLAVALQGGNCRLILFPKSDK